MRFRTEIITEIDDAVFDYCYDDCAPEVRANLPWHISHKKLVEEGLTPEKCKAAVRRMYKDWASKKAHEDGLAFQLVDDDTGRVMAMYTAKVEPNNTLLIGYNLFSNDLNGSRAWVLDYFASNTLREFCESVGCNRWYAELFGDGIYTAAKDYFQNDGPLSETVERTRIYSKYGWSDNQ